MAAQHSVATLVSWNQPCSEANLAKISLLIVDWRAVSPFLGLSEADELVILGTHPHSVPAQKIAMLRKWKSINGTKATYSELCQVFRMCELTSLEEKVKQMLGGESYETNAVDSTPLLPCVPTIYEDDPVSSYSSYLKELYTSMSQSHTSQHWTHLPRCEFIQLAMILDEELRRGGAEEEMVRLAQQGKIETILSHKKNIDMNQLFDKERGINPTVTPPPSPLSPSPIEHKTQFPLEGLDLLSLLRPNPRTILIEGAPGGGKSTLALHFCHQWAKEASWLARFDLVILAYLRDEAIQNAKCLTDILPAHISELKEITFQIQASYGQGVLFIFDGWDEFPSHLMNNSLVSKIIQNPQTLFLHRSTVLITSRPVSSGNLLHIADRRVEILGFTRQQIREYIEKALDGNSTHIQKLVQHLEEHPVIDGYCYIPLHAAILVHIFLTMKGALPTTLHELFCSLVLCCIIREQETHEPVSILPELTSLDDLPDELKTKLGNLNILAYEGVMHNKVVFYSKDIQAVHLQADISSLGLLQAIEGLTLYSKSRSYNFLHLSVQELLAAYHISQMRPTGQVEVFKKLFGSSRFQAVLQYYCGFTKLANLEIQNFIYSYQQHKFRFKQLLPLLHCFFEAQQPSLCKLVDPRFIPSARCKMIDSANLDPIDILAIGYFFSSLLCTLPLCISGYHLSIRSDHHLKLLLSQLPKRELSTGKLLVLEYTSFIWQEISPIVAHFKQSHAAIRELVITNNEIHNFLHITDAIRTNSSVVKLDLQYNYTLISLNLSHTVITASDPDIATSLTHFLKRNKSLKYLTFQGNRLFSDFGALCLFEGLQYNSTLVHLNLNYTRLRVTHPDTAMSMITMIKVNRTLTHLLLANDDNTLVENQIVFCVSQGLKDNTTSALTHLILRGNLITAHDAECLTQLLMYNRCLQTLDIAYSGTWFQGRLTQIISSLWYNNSSLKLLFVTTSRDDEESYDNLNQERQKHGLPPIDIRIV